MQAILCFSTSDATKLRMLDVLLIAIGFRSPNHPLSPYETRTLNPNDPSSL